MKYRATAMPLLALKKLPRLLLRTFLLTTIGLVVLLGIGLGVLATLKHQILRAQLMNVLRTEFSYESVAVDWWSDFPNLHITATHLHLKDTHPELDFTPLTVGQVDVKLNPLALLRNPYRKYIPRLVARDVVADFPVDTRGVNGNMFFAHYDPKRKMPEEVRIDDLRLYNARFIYNYYPEDRGYEYAFDSLKVRVVAHPHSIHIEPKAYFTVRYMREGDFRYLEEKPVRMFADATISKGNKNAEIHAMDLFLAGTNMTARGSFPFDRPPYYDIQLAVPNGDIETILSLMPKEAGDQIRAFEPSGQFSFTGHLKGTDDATTNPHFELQFATQNARIKAVEQGLALSDLHLVGSFSNGPQNSAATVTVALDTILGQLNGYPLKASLYLENFNDLAFRGQLATQLDLDQVLQYQNLPVVNKPTGELALDMKAAGRFRHLKSLETLNQVHLDANLKLDSVGFTTQGLPLRISALDGYLMLNDSILEADSLTFRLNDQPFELNLQVNDALKYLAKLTPNLRLNGTLNVFHLNVDSLLGGAREIMAQTAKPSANQNPLAILWAELPTNLFIDLDFIAEDVTYRGHPFDYFIVTPRIRAGVIELEDILATGPQDTLRASARLDARHPEFNRVDVQTHLASQNTFKLLRDFTGIDSLPEAELRFGLDFGVGGRVYSARAPHTVPDSAALAVSLNNLYAAYPARDLHLEGFNTQTLLHVGHLNNWAGTGLVLERLSGRINNDPFSAAFAVENWESRTARLQLNSTLTLENLVRIGNLNQLQDPAGRLAVDLELAGKLDHFSRSDSLPSVLQRGTINFQNAQLGIAGLRIGGINGQLALDNHQQLLVSDFIASLGQSDLRLNGHFNNLIPYLQKKNRALSADLELLSDTLRLQDFIPEDFAPTENSPALRLPHTEAIQVDAKVGHLNLGAISTGAPPFVLDDIDLKTRLERQVLNVDHLRATFADGSITALGRVDASDTLRYPLRLDATLEGIHMDTFLLVFGDFDQDLLTHQELHGRANLRLSYLDQLPATLQPDFKFTRARASVEIQDGRLTGFEQLQKLKPFVPGRFLEDVAFTLQAPEIQLYDSTLYISGLQLRSSVLDIDAKGQSKLYGQTKIKLAVSLVKRYDRVFESRIVDFLTRPTNKTVLHFNLLGSPAGEYQLKLDADKALRYGVRSIFW